MWNTIHMRIPEQLAEKISVDNTFVLSVLPPRLQTIENGYLHRTVDIWNQLEDSIRCLLSLNLFKIKVKKWLRVRRNPTMELEPD